MIRYDLTFSAPNIAIMREHTDGQYVKWADYIALVSVNLRLRDKLLELAKECSDCDGTGLQTIHGETGPCPVCDDIRSVLGQ